MKRRGSLMIGNDKSQSLRIRGGSQMGDSKLPAILVGNEEDVFWKGGSLP
jgi:hypothetical protein